MKKDRLDIRGFSLAEITAVMALLAIVAAVVISRAETSSANLATQAEILKAHLRDAQIKAMAGRGAVDIFGIKWDAGFYWMFRGNNPDGGIVRLFDDRRFDVDDDGKLSLAAKKISISAPLNTVFFDNRGIPYSAYSDETNNTPLTDDLLIAVRPYGASSPSRTLTVTQHTGFIP